EPPSRRRRPTSAEAGPGPGQAPGRRSPATIRAQPVPGVADCLDPPQPERPVDLGPQVADIDVDDVGAALVAVVPGMVEKVDSGQDMSWAAHERLQQGELLGGELELDVLPPH